MNISEVVHEKWNFEENIKAIEINQNCWRKLERYRNISMELNEHYNDAVDINSDYRRQLEMQK